MSALCALGALAAQAASAPPTRIVSMNLCTDQIILAIAPREHIRSLSYLSARPDISAAASQVAGIPLNHGLSEEILPMEPDLVIAGRYTARPTVFLLQDLGYPLVDFDISRNLDDIRDRVRRMGDVVGEQDRAEDLIAAFEARLAALQPQPGTKRPTALYLRPNGGTAGRESLAGDVIEQAGFENLGARFGVTGFGQLPLEKLLVEEPDVIITDEDRPHAPALAYEFIKHPAVQAVLARAHRVIVPIRYWICGMPGTLKAVEILAEARHQVTGEPRS